MSLVPIVNVKSTVKQPEVMQKRSYLVKGVAISVLGVGFWVRGSDLERPRPKSKIESLGFDGGQREIDSERERERGEVLTRRCRRGDPSGETRRDLPRAAVSLTTIT